MTKLLNKPLKAFIIFTCIALVCSIPVYFYLVESIWIDELDDHNQHIKEQIQSHFNEPDQEKLNEKIALWNDIQSTSKIAATTDIHSDKVYITEKEMVEEDGMELERFRGLSASVLLNGKPYNLIIESNIEEVHESVLAISVITCLFIVLLIAGFIILNRRISRRIWRPFTDSLFKLKQFDLNSNANISFAATDIQEFAELNAAMSNLIENNIRVYTQQKEFTQNASHELQTPLALLKTRIDMLIQDQSLTPTQREIIGSLDNAVSRVARVNKNLLLLAGIENKKYETEEVDLSSVVNTLTETFKDFADDKRCNISTNIQDRLYVKANESLLEILVSNLLSNALRHGQANSVITVTLNDLGITVCNEGKASLNKDTLFRRFLPATTNNPGSGLGLAIVKEICDKYSWRIVYSFAGQQHIFSIFF